MENTTRRPISTSSVEREIPVFHAQNMHGTLAHEIGKKKSTATKKVAYCFAHRTKKMDKKHGNTEHAYA